MVNRENISIEAWALRRKEEMLLETTEMRTLRRIKRVKLKGRARSGDITRAVLRLVWPFDGIVQN